jgi:hypothetical protein
VQAIRDELGSSFGIGVKFHGRVHPPKVLAKGLGPWKEDVRRWYPGRQ